MRNSAKIDARSIALELESRIEAAGRRKEKFLDLMGDVQTRNMQKISEATEDYEGQVELLRFVRDTSADGLMVGASIMSGGAAGFAALRAGSILKGVAKWEIRAASPQAYWRRRAASFSDALSWARNSALKKIW
jgi:hypothetical protein